MVTTFLNTLKDPYYAHLIGHTTSSFADLVIIGECVEDGMKSRRLVDTHLLQTLTEQRQRETGNVATRRRCPMDYHNTTVQKKFLADYDASQRTREKERELGESVKNGDHERDLERTHIFIRK